MEVPIVDQELDFDTGGELRARLEFGGDDRKVWHFTVAMDFVMKGVVGRNECAFRRSKYPVFVRDMNSKVN